MTSTPSKATAGPWKWHARSDDQAHNGAVYSEHREGHAYAIAMQPRYVSDEEWTANARLIAAAPDLLAALTQAEIAVAELCQDQNPANECWNILRQVRAAISRATGEA